MQASEPEEVAGRTAGAVAVVTKEMSVTAEQIAGFDDSVRLIAEAGTGFNNIDLLAAAAKGIAVCNVPDYSAAAVAQLVATFLLNHSASLPQQQTMLASGDRSNFGALQVAHLELAGRTLGLVGGTGSIGRQVIAPAPTGVAPPRAWPGTSSPCCFDSTAPVHPDSYIRIRMDFAKKAQKSFSHPDSYPHDPSRAAHWGQRTQQYNALGGGGVEGGFLIACQSPRISPLCMCWLRSRAAPFCHR